MDSVALPLPVMHETLRFLERTNRWAGGVDVVLGHLAAWSRRWPAGAPIRILDIGTGGADIPVAIAAWARKHGHKVSLTAIDPVREVVAVARERAAAYPEIAVEQADLDSLAAGDETYDYVTASLLLHHLPPAEAVGAVQDMDALATRGVIVSDLHRTLPGYCAVSLLARLLGNAVVRHDGPLSVRRAFLPGELDAIAREAGLPYLRARVHRPWFRVSLAGEKPVRRGA